MVTETRKPVAKKAPTVIFSLTLIITLFNFLKSEGRVALGCIGDTLQSEVSDLILTPTLTLTLIVHALQLT